MQSLYTFVVLGCCIQIAVHSQVDTALIYKVTTPYGALDIRLSKAPDHYYYLQENKTFSFRTDNGEPTNTYLNMTAWDSSPYLEGNMREKTDSSDQFVMNYRLLMPQHYSANFAGGYPLVIVLHGLLERGNCAEEKCYHAGRSYNPKNNDPPASTEHDNMLLNNDYNLIHAGLDYLEANQSAGAAQPGNPNLPAASFPGFVLFPQNLNGWDASAAHDAIRLIRLIKRTYNIDPDRVYVNGISHGGHGAYELLKRAPWLFAAGVLFSAADDASLVNQKTVDRIAAIPLWIFQGGLDQNPTQERTENYIKAFRKSGAVVRYTVYPGLGHGTWNKALDEPDFFSWLLAQKRNKIHVNAGRALICSTGNTGLSLALPEGFKSYEWEFNGTMIRDAVANTYIAREAGAYRGRFRLYNSGTSDGWSQWSDVLNVKVSESGIPEINQTGTLLLRDLNGNPDANLSASIDMPFYYWYKDGNQLTSAGDTMKTVKIGAGMGDGAYSLRVADYDLCKSLESNVKHIVFNDAAPINLPAPSDFSGKAISPSEILLNWFDASISEDGFEIWRRTKDASGNFSPWVMPVLTEPNTLSFSDKGLKPDHVYYYRIRAVNASSRSDYTPADSEQLEVATPSDHQAPTAPQNLSAMQAGVNSIRLTWHPSEDNSSIHQYIILYSNDSLFTNTIDTTYILKNLEPNTDYSFTVRAVDPSGNVSSQSNVAGANTFLRGLYYEHSTGAWESISMIDWSTPEFSGIIDDFALSPRTQQDFFNFKFDGYLNIKREGVYQFRLTSDDGSILDLNDSLLIANDGIHNVNTVTSPVQVLSAGAQRITVKYFDYILSDTLLVQYKGPDSDGEWIKIPQEVLSSQNITAVGPKPEVEKEFNFDLYPNPARQGRIIVQLITEVQQAAHILIRDMTGRLLSEFTSQNIDHLEILLPAHIEAGVYLLTIRQGSSLMSKRFVISPQ